MQSFSIIICTYNPSLSILERLFTSVKQLKQTNYKAEVILVDNNSTPAIANYPLVQDFVAALPNVKLISEKTPGLTSARMTGIKNAQYDWIVFFDDDNEPAADYLLNASVLINDFPLVGAWGPGNLDVLYIGKKETPFLKRIKWLFQQRNIDSTYFNNNITEGSEYYPFGTGMIIRKNCLTEYVKCVENKKYTMSDRIGKSLASAGDTQILFTCLQMGYYAGSSKILQLNHLIKAEKATPQYAAKLVYALNSSHLKAYNEVFSNTIECTGEISNLVVLKKIYSAIRLYHFYKKDYTLKMFISKKLGELNARIVAGDLQRPFALKLFENYISR